MEIKVKEVEGPGQKSVQEVESELLDKHDQEVNQEVDNSPEEVNQQVDNSSEEVNQEVDNSSEQVEAQSSELKEEDVLSFIKNRYEKDINSVDELFAQREANEDLPEDVSAFLKYKKETGRGIEDFMKLQADYDNMNESQLLRDYYASTESDLDSEDIEYLMSERFSYDEDLDDESEVKAKKIAMKRELAKAKKYFNDLKDTYKVPVESSGSLVDEGEMESYKAYKEYISQSQSIQEQNQKRSEYFTKKTDELFNDDFKGFDFTIGDQKMVFNPGDVKETKKIQSDVNNFISKYLDDNGMIKDPVGYHKSLTAALNPDKLASYFYEKGKADAVGDVTRRSKNIDMDLRSTPQQMKSSGEFKVRAVDNDSGRGLKIRKR